VSDPDGGLRGVTERDPGRTDLGTVTAAYGAAASLYIERFASADRADAEDRERIRDWAAEVRGPVLDAGCGPGHWSAFLHELGAEVEGVDATPEFVAHATRTWPGVDFRLGDLRRLDLPEGGLGGVLAWYSVIHAEPEEVPDVLAGLARALRPGGSLLLGFFSGSRLQPFDHRVVTAWAWPVDRLVATVEAAGLTVRSTRDRAAPNGRRNASLVAERPEPATR
jgi:SAM-dependent methyltransferase